MFAYSCAALVQWFTYFSFQVPSLLSSSFFSFYPSSQLPPLLPVFLPSLLPGSFMSQVTEGSCALERAPYSRSSKYPSVCCVLYVLLYWGYSPEWGWCDILQLLWDGCLLCLRKQESEASRKTIGLARSYFYCLWICKHICFVRVGCHKHIVAYRSGA